MFADYHVHTPLCHHAVGLPAEYIAVARERGLSKREVYQRLNAR